MFDHFSPSGGGGAGMLAGGGDPRFAGLPLAEGCGRDAKRGRLLPACPLRGGAGKGLEINRHI